MKEAFEAFQKEVVAKQEVKAKESADKNLKAGEAFLAENAKKEGVVTLPSGLQYKVIEAGSGKTPKASDTVTVNYRGTLIDGKEFDSSYKRGEPATFPVSGVIAGWTEALQLMKEGAKWQLVIPPGLAYGEKGAGPVIGPNSTLVFEVELIKVQ
jgi:FKBP-type peptidyl-prolyl cis-trans isomerase FklB